jgi:hypothetical protein
MPEQRDTAAPRAWLAGVRQRLDAFLSGAPPSDPLYLSNRTWTQKLRPVALIGIPVLIMALVIVAAATDSLHLRRANPYDRPAAAEPVPTAPETAVESSPQALEVSNLHIARDVHPPVVTGEFRNNTDHPVHSAEITYFVADNNGSVLATESAQVLEVGPHRVVTFRAPLKSSQADYVLVREVRAN